MDDAKPLRRGRDREVVRNRGTQFAPAVVDAFVTLVERMPELFGTDPLADELVPA